nr:ribonuclease H-like domain-containing protein [Tanacetum cinerariifolium]
MGTFREILVEGDEGALHLGPKRPRVYSDLSPKEKERFVTVMKLNKGLRDSNYDQLYTYLKQHEAHANENKMMLDRFTQHTVDPFAFMSNVSHQQYYPQSSTNFTIHTCSTTLYWQGRLSATTTMADKCDVFDFDIDEAPTAQTMFMENLSFVDPVYDEADPSYDSDILSEHQHLKEIFRNNKSLPVRGTPDFDSVFVIDKMKASIQGKENAIKKLRMQISQLKETRSEADRILDFRALGVNSCTDASGTKPRSNTKKNRISPAKSVNKKQVEEHPRTNKSSLNHMNRRTDRPLYLDSGCSKHITGDRSRLENFMKKFIETVRFKNDYFGAIMGYEDYVIGDSVISREQITPQLDYDCLEQINDDDMEEMDLKWHVAMISMRIKKFHKRTRRKLQFDTKDPVDNKRRDVGYNGNKTRDNGRRSAYHDDSKALVTIDEEDIDWSGHVEEDAQNYAMMAYSSSNSGSGNEIVFMNKASDLEDTLVNDRFDDEMHAVPTPMTGNYMSSRPDGGSVAFGGSNGRITRKGKTKTGRLDFEDVYYMEELKHYNLFSVSQMCDKKNKVLFTDTNCLVLSPNFKLPDENQKGKQHKASLENQANKSSSLKEANYSACTQASDDQDANSKEIDLNEEHFEKEANDAAESLSKEATSDIQNASTSSTDLINNASIPLSTARPSRAFNDGQLLYPDPSKYALLDDTSMPRLEDIYASPSEGIFTDLSYDDEGVVTDIKEKDKIKVKTG